MSWDRHRTPRHGGSAPATPGFNAVAPEWLINYGAADAAPAVPAAESTLGSHPCVALSSAQVLPEWIHRNLACNRFAANGDNPLNFVSHSRGSLQPGAYPPVSTINHLVESNPEMSLRDINHLPVLQPLKAVLNMLMYKEAYL